MRDTDAILTADSGQRTWYPEMNILRGILVILVVVGHVTLQADTGNVSLKICLDAIGNTIYSFHMPAFFTVSGFCAIKSIGRVDKGKYIKSRCLALMVPYLVMSVVYIPFRLSLSFISRTSYNITDAWKILVGDSPDGALWFLYALFIISAVVCLLVSLKNAKLVLGIAIVLYIISSFAKWPFGIIGKLFGCFPFYLMGLILRKHYQKYKSIICSKSSILVCTLGFIIGNVVLQLLQIEVIRFIPSLTGFCLLLNVAAFITNRRGCVYQIFDCIGNYGMDIYMLSEPCKVIVRTMLKFLPDALAVLATICSTIVISMLISKLFIRKNRILSMLILGKQIECS